MLKHFSRKVQLTQTITIVPPTPQGWRTLIFLWGQKRKKEKLLNHWTDFQTSKGLIGANFVLCSIIVGATAALTPMDLRPCYPYSKQIVITHSMVDIYSEFLLSSSLKQELQGELWQQYTCTHKTLQKFKLNGENQVSPA